ncbi:MAG: molybdopterin-binding protein [Desulfobacteraceae bacterium]|jgi:molybdopterin biosynthesis enzyme
MQSIPVHQAIGHVLAHDVTRIVPGVNKGPAFKKGHVIREQDIEALLDMGKAHIYVLELSSQQVHEDAAAGRIAAAAAGPGLKLTAPSEGRINLVAEYTGLLKVNVPALTRLNGIRDVVFATLHGNHRVEAGQPVAGTRVIPLVVSEQRVSEAEAVCRRHHPLIAVKPFESLRVGMITTGSEVFLGRIKDRFGPVVRKKFQALGSRVIRQIFVADDIDKMVEGIGSLIDEGARMVVLTGGMSVDPDDRTTAGIRSAGAEVMAYGAPTFPGAMFMLAYIGDIPVLGLPGCVMYHRTSIFDLVVPRLLTGERLRREEIAGLGHGGFCAGCDQCRYPLCGFGKV